MISSANRGVASPAIKGRSTDAGLLRVSLHTIVLPLRRNREQTADNRSRYVADNGSYRRHSSQPSRKHRSGCTRSYT